MNATITISAVAALAFSGILAYNYYTATALPDDGSAFPNGSFVIQSANMPYLCAQSTPGGLPFVECNQNSSAQLFSYNDTYNNIVDYTGLCLDYSTNDIKPAQCIGSATQSFFYNTDVPMIQNTCTVNGSSLFLHTNILTASMVSGCFTNISQDSSYNFKSLPQISFGPWSGRYVKISVSIVQCLNLAEIVVLSNPFDNVNAALSAIVTKSSTPTPDSFPVSNINDMQFNSVTATTCQGAPWVQLDFGRVIPITQIIVINPTGMVPAPNLIGAILTIGDQNNNINYTSNSITENTMYNIFNPPSVSVITDIKGAKPLSCEMSTLLYSSKYTVPANTSPYTYFTNSGSALGHSWYGPPCYTYLNAVK